MPPAFEQDPAQSPEVLAGYGNVVQLQAAPEAPPAPEGAQVVDPAVQAELEAVQAELDGAQKEAEALAARLEALAAREALLLRRAGLAPAGEEQDPDAPLMTVADAVVYLNHLIVTNLRELAEGFRITQAEGATERDKRDATTVLGVCEDLIGAAVSANEDIMRRKDRKVVVVADDSTMKQALATILRGRK